MKKERIKLELPFHAEVKNWSTCNKQTSEWITCYRSDTAAILFYALTGGKPIFQIKLQKKDSAASDLRVGGYLAHSPDSIFILLAEERTILLFNQKGEITNTYQVNIPLQGGVTNYCFVSTSASPMLCDGKNLYVTATRLDITVRDKISRQNYFTLFPEVQIPLDGSLPKSLAGNWPQCYLNGDSYRDFFPQRCLFKNQLVYGYSATDSLYCSASLALEKKPFDLLGKQVSPYPDDSIGNFSFLECYDVTQSRYLSFLHDSYRGYYYRIFQQGIVYEQENGMTVNEWLDKPWRLLVMNETGDAVHALDFDPKMYFPMVLVSKGGIWVRDRKKENGIVYWDLYVFQAP